MFFCVDYTVRSFLQCTNSPCDNKKQKQTLARVRSITEDCAQKFLAPSPVVTVPQAFKLITMLYCVHRWNPSPDFSTIPACKRMHFASFGPHGLTFTWWGCCGLSFWHKPTELAHSFYSVLVVSISVLMAPFNCISFHSPLSHSVLPVLFLPYWSLHL